MCTKSHAKAEVERVKEMLTERGIKYEEYENGMISFQNTSGTCSMVASQTYDGLIYVLYSAKARCETAEEALEICGVV